MSDTIAQPNVKVHRRICPFCEQNCATLVKVDHDTDEVIEVRGDKDDPLSKGYICPKAFAVKDMHNDPDLLTGPVIKKNGKFEPVSWEEAFDFAAAGIKKIQDKYGRNAFGFFFGTTIAHVPGLALYTGPLLNVLQTQQIYSTSSIDCHPHFLAAATMFGGLASLPVPDIDNSDYFVLIGANPMQSNGSFMTAPNVPGRLKDIRKRGGKVVVIDPRRTETADMADWHLSVAPGGDAALLLAVVNTLFAEDLVDLGHLADRARGLDQVRELATGFTPEKVSARTGIAPDDIRTLARELAAAKSACIYGRIGSCMQQFGSVTNWLITTVNALTGNLDSVGGAMFPGGTFQPVIMSETVKDGQIPYDRYRSRVSNFPELAGQFPSALMIEEMTVPGEGQIKAMATMGSNPALSSPNGGGRLTEALENLEFMLSFDIYINETTQHADVILPSPPHLHHSDFMIFFTFLTVRDYIKYAPAIFETPEDRLHDSEIFCELISRLTGVTPQEADDSALRMLYDQLCDQGNEILSSMSFDQVVQYIGSEPGEERMFDMLLRSGPYGDHFGARPDGLTLEKLKANDGGMDFGPMKPRIEEVLHFPGKTIDFAPAAIVSDVDRVAEWVAEEESTSLHLVGRRQIRTCNTWMHNFKSLAKGPELCVLLMHPDDAEKRAIAEGDRVTVRSRTGEVSVPVKITDEMRRGVVSLPHGWGHDDERVPGMERAKARPGANYNHLADETLLDAPSGIVNLNHIPVEVLAEEAA